MERQIFYQDYEFGFLENIVLIDPKINHVLPVLYVAALFLFP